jgi:HlyD family secretion protein
VLRIPSASIAEGGRVLVLDGEYLRERVVETGLKNWQFTEVRSGLEEGELVVISRESPDIADGALAVARED